MKNKRWRGFTLIELLVAIAIIGILAGAVLMIVNPLEQLKKSRDAQRKHDLSQVQKALEVYYNDKGKYPDSIPSDTWPGYLEVVPKDPKSGQTYKYQQDSAGGYRLFATLERCASDTQVMQISCEANPTNNYSITSPNLVPAPFGVAVTSTPVPSATATPTSTPTSVLASCADGTVEQTYSSSMVGCNGSEKFDSATSLCVNGSHVCSASEYFARGGNTTVPTADRWLSSHSGNVMACTVANGSCQSNSTTCYVLVPLTQDDIFGAYTDSNFKRAYSNDCNNLTNKIGWISHDFKNKKFGAMCCSL